MFAANYLAHRLTGSPARPSRRSTDSGDCQYFPPIVAHDGIFLCRNYAAFCAACLVTWARSVCVCAAYAAFCGNCVCRWPRNGVLCLNYLRRCSGHAAFCFRYAVLWLRSVCIRSKYAAFCATCVCIRRNYAAFCSNYGAFYDKGRRTRDILTHFSRF